MIIQIHIADSLQILTQSASFLTYHQLIFLYIIVIRKY